MPARHLVARAVALFAASTRAASTTLFGHDAFISYSRKDGRGYVVRLQQKLESAGLIAFVDYEAIPPGEKLRGALDRAVRRSRLLVVLSTPAAIASPWVALEVETFAKTGRKIIPINVEGLYEHAPWRQHDLDLVWIDESASAVRDGQPSPGVAEGILAQTTHTRRRSLVRRLGGAVLFALGLAAATAFWNWRAMHAQRELAAAQGLTALSQSARQIEYGRPEIAALIALQAIRHGQTPQASEALFSAARLMRPLDASRHIGRIVSAVHIDPSDSTILATGWAHGTDRGFVCVLEALDLAPRWCREQPGELVDVSRSADGREVAVVGGARGVTILDAASGTEVRRLGAGGFLRVRFSPRGPWLVTASDAGAVDLWDRRTWSLVGTGRAGRNVLALAFSEDGGRLFAAGGADGDGRSILAAWRVEGGLREEVRANVDGAISRLAVGPDGRLIATGAQIFDAWTLLPKARLAGSGLDAVAFSPDGSHVACACGNRTVRVFRAQDGLETAILQHADRVVAAEFDPSGEALATASWDGTARVWKLPSVSGEPAVFIADAERARLGHTKWVHALAFDRQRGRLVTGSADGFVRAWNLAPDSALGELRAESISALALVPDGSGVITAGTSYAPIAWTLSGAPSRRLPAHENDLQDVAVDRASDRVATAGSDDLVQVYDNWRSDRVVKLPVRARRLTFVDGRVVTAGHSGIAVWDTRHTPPQSAAVPVTSPIRGLAAVSASSFAAGNAAGQLTVYSLHGNTPVQAQQLRLPAAVTAVAASQEGGLIAVAADDGLLRLYRERDLQLQRVISIGEPAQAVALDRHGGHVATGGGAGVVTVWSTSDGAMRVRLPHGSEIRSIDFSNSARSQIFFGGPGGFAFAPWKSSDIVSAACARLAGRELTEAEWRRFIGDSPKEPACP